MRVGIEIGGTFTDLVAVLDDGRIETAKALSTPGDPAQGALTVLRQWRADPRGVRHLVHGSTVATNAVLERKGAPTGLLVTAGHRDVLEIQRHEKSDIFDLQFRKPIPIVPRRHVVEVEERLDAQGRIIDPLRLDEPLERALARLVRDEGLTSIAIVLLHSYLNASHEDALAALVGDRFPGVSVSRSSDVNPEYREYERASTTVMNAYLRPVIDRYLEELQRLVREAGVIGEIRIMQSGGGVMPIEAARERAVNVILSGPAAGAVGASHMAMLAGYRDVITLDMGGTSTDVSLVRGGKPALTFETRIDELPIRVPCIDIQAVGAGGGSVAWLDPSGALRVGPRSAGADPGPCCYGRGGAEPTTTDANALLGLLRPKRFFGGRLALDIDAAVRAVGDLAERLALTPHDLAEGIRRIANANMVEAIRLVSVERGHDPRDFALLAFGGAGALHACDLARELQIDTVLVPENQGVLSAFGLLVSDFRHSAVQTLLMRGRGLDLAALTQRLDALIAQARQDCARYGLTADGLLTEASVGIRYVGQASELDVAIDLNAIDVAAVEGWVSSFHAAYRQRFGHAFPEKEVQLVNLRVALIQPAEPVRLEPKPAGRAPALETGRIYIGRAWQQAVFVWRPDLSSGFAADGPLIVEDHHATTFVSPGWRLRVDPHGTLVLTDTQHG
ncbi:MAG: hydantoinase/oxoprolinase family protein [Pseudomonadota bacterium]